MSTETMESDFSSRTGGSAERALRVLQYIAERSQPVPLAELTKTLNLPKPTIHRLCQMLMSIGMIKQDIEDKTFLVGPALQQLAMNTLNHGTLSELRHSVLSDLVDEVGETCNFTTLNGSSVLYLDRVETRHPWRLTIGVGERVPVHCTASGKLFLAFLPTARRNYLLRRLELRQLTEHTITNQDQLRDSLDAIATAGYAQDIQEFITGLVALAVPVYDEEGNVRAAVALHGPTSRLDASNMISLLPALQSAASRMSALL